MSNAPKTKKTLREKQQPDGRYQMGLLRKKNDYNLRAQDHKQEQVAKLSIKI